jgi:hypothetical protein
LIFLICILIQDKTGTGHTMRTHGNTWARRKPCRFLCKLVIKNVPTHSLNGSKVFFSLSIGLQIFKRIHSPFLNLWYAYRQIDGQIFQRDANESVLVICLHTDRRTSLPERCQRKVYLWYAYRQIDGQVFQRDANESVLVIGLHTDRRTDLPEGCQRKWTWSKRFIQNVISLFPKTLGFRDNSNGYSAYCYKIMGLRLKNWITDGIKVVTQQTSQNYYYTYTILQRPKVLISFSLSLYYWKSRLSSQVKPIINTAITQSDLLTPRCCLFTFPTIQFI